MWIERSAFLAWTAALAGCGSPPAPTVVVPNDAPAPVVPPVAAAPPPALSREPAPAPPPPPPACGENLTGSLAVCDTWKVDPTCEGASTLRNECGSLADFAGRAEPDGFQPAVAEKVARCLTAKPVSRAGGCRKADMHTCIRDAVDTVCVEPEMVAACEKRVAACTARKAPLTFSVAECSRIASSTRGPMRAWALEAMSGLDSTGAPTREGCTLQYVTVYQPWPRNWWTGTGKPKKQP